MEQISNSTTDTEPGFAETLKASGYFLTNREQAIALHFYRQSRVCHCGEDSTGWTSLDQVPRDALIEMLTESVWYSGGRDFNGKEGYSLEVDERTCFRDVSQGAVLHPTRESAILDYWEKLHSTTD